QSHHFLDSNPTDEAYLQPIRVQQQVTQLLQQLVEGAGLDSLSPSAPLYSIDPLSIRSLIHLAPTPLAIILQWDDQHPIPTAAFAQEQELERPAWCFLTLELYTEGDDQWSSSLEEALKKGASKVGGGASAAKSAMRIPTPKVPPKTREEMAEGEGTTPGAYGDAEDFWGGYSDDEGASAEQGGNEQEVQEVREDDYWESYGEVESELAEESGGGLDLRGEEEAAGGAPKSITRSRRSSTIRPPIIPSPSQSTATSYFSPPESISTTPTLDSHADSTPTLPSLPSPTKDLPTPPPSSTRLDAALPPAPSHFSNSLITAFPPSTSTSGEEKDLPAPLLNGHHSASEEGADVEDREEESLRFALAGVWQLYAGGAGGSKDKRDRWLRIASQVTQV
ncbi:hypothetical protein BCR35DRAFT_310553, partial [Leucosporidium creatinivorum]